METIRRSTRRNTKIKENIHTLNTEDLIRTRSKNPLDLSNKKNISINLLDKFDTVKNSELNLDKYFDEILDSERKSTIDIFSTTNTEQHDKFYSNKKQADSGDILNEIYNKINYYKQLINFKEELNYLFIREVNNFIQNSIKIFNNENMSISNEQLQMIKESFLRTENLIYNNLSLIDRNDDIEEKQKFLDIIQNFFDFVEGKLESSNGEISDMISKINDIMDNIIVTQSTIEKEKLSHDFSDDTNPVTQLSNKKIKKLNKNRNLLLDKVYIKKSKTNYGQNDVVEHEDIILPYNNEAYKRILQKSKNLFLRNFLQIFLIKDDGIFSESYFSKIDKSLLRSYNKFKFYEIKFYFSHYESFEDISNHIQKIRKLFIRYLMLYKETKNKKFIKITFCGVGKKQSVMKRLLINFMSYYVKNDCLFKISLFSNIFDCMSPSLNKVENAKDTYFYSNYDNSVLDKILKNSVK